MNLYSLSTDGLGDFYVLGESPNVAYSHVVWPHKLKFKTKASVRLPCSGKKLAANEGGILPEQGLMHKRT